MSASPPKADIRKADVCVCYVPKADAVGGDLDVNECPGQIDLAVFHLIEQPTEGFRDRQTKMLGGPH